MVSLLIFRVKKKSLNVVELYTYSSYGIDVTGGTVLGLQVFTCISRPAASR